MERFAWVFNKPPRRTAVPAPCVAAITRLETRIAAGRSIARGRWARAMPLNTKHNFPEARLPSNPIGPALTVPNAPAAQPAPPVVPIVGQSEIIFSGMATTWAIDAAAANPAATSLIICLFNGGPWGWPYDSPEGAYDNSCAPHPTYRGD